MESAEVRVLAGYTPEDRARLRAGNDDPSGVAEFHLEWRPKDQHLGVFLGGHLVSHAGLVKHTIQVGGRAVAVAGFGGVLTHPDHQGRGFARLAMQEAEAHARAAMDVPFGALFCKEQMQPWYEQMGWRTVREQVWIEQPQGTVAMPMPMMVKALGAETWPAGAIVVGCFPW